jgi:CHAT domain-containing protein
VRAPSVPLSTATVPLLAIGSPDLSAAVRDRVTATAPGWTLRATEMADAEIRTVAAPFAEQPAAVLSGAAATEAALRAQAPSAFLLHLAAPFRMNGASPLFSPLLLSADPAPGAERPAENDGVLEVREVMNLDLHARVAIFSDGAATSMRDAAPAAETVRWAWRAAGVPSIVMSRWMADENVGGALLAEFYTRLQSGEAPEAALQGARVMVRTAFHPSAQKTRAGDPGEDTRAPYFWAGWMLIGR